MAETKQKKKIISAFCLTADGKQKLQEFFDRNYALLSSRFPLQIFHVAVDTPEMAAAKKELQELIRETFPPEALTEIAKALRGESEYAVLVKNCPEMAPASETIQGSYSYHIGTALYEMHGNHSMYSTMLKRQSHHKDGLSKNSLLRSIHVHRDMLHHTENLILSYPLNSEHAKTTIIDMPALLRDVPEDTVFDSITVRGGVRNTSREVQGMLDRREVSGIDFQFARRWDMPTQRKFADLVGRHSETVDMQPGDLLVFNEHTIFHQGGLPDPEIVARIPLTDRHSRIVLHNAGTATPQR